MSPVGRLDGRVALVTGGGRGLGRTFAGALAAEGAKVALADLADPEPAAEAVRAAHGAGRALACTLDVSDEAQVASVVARVLGWGGRIDVLVNNAALYASLSPVAPTEIDTALWDRVMAVNVRGPFLMAKHVAPDMMARGSGKILNVSSGTAYKGLPRALHYVTSKAALLGFTRALSRDLGPHGICVNALAPGLVLSEGVLENAERLALHREGVLRSRALARDGHPRDLLGALLFLCSADSDFVTGQTIVVDGGSVNT